MMDAIPAIGIGPELTMVVGLYIPGPRNQWEQMLTEWAEETLRKSREAGIDVEADDYTLLRIEMPCGEVMRLKTLDDVPRSTMPCPCGSPGRYLIMYSEPEICGK